MTNSKFRPRIECLEGRDVPASLTFQFADGTAGYGTFTEPAGVDDSASIWLEVTDLTVYYNGTAYEPTGTVEAWYDYGSLADIAGTFVDVSSNSITLGFNTATFNTYSTPFALDPADTQATFSLPGGVTAALSYDIPWASVDPAQASQSIPLTAFNLNIAGQNFAYGSADFTTNPSALFEYGEFKGLSYSINTSATPGFAYSSVSQSGMTITAVPNVGQPILVLAAVKEPALVIDFSSYNSTSTAHTLRVRWKLSDGTDELVQVPIAAGTAPGVVRDLVASVLQDNGLKATELGETRLRVKGTAAAKFKELSIDVINAPAGWAGPAYAGRVVTPDISPKFILRGTEYP